MKTSISKVQTIHTSDCMQARQPAHVKMKLTPQRSYNVHQVPRRKSNARGDKGGNATPKYRPVIHGHLLVQDLAITGSTAWT